MSLKIKKGMREDDSDEDHDLEMLLRTKPKVSDVIVKPKKSVIRICHYGEASHTK